MSKLRLRIFPPTGLPRHISKSRFTGCDPAKPQATVPQRIGGNGTGRYCNRCGGVTYGLSDRCGSCGRANGLVVL